MDLAETAIAASARLYDLICSALKEDRGVHIETAITAAGYLAGYELLRSTKIDLSALTPGSPVFGVPGVDETGPRVMQFITDACSREGFSGNLPSDFAVPPAHRPRKSYIELMERLGAPYRRIVEDLPIEPRSRWVVPAHAAVRLIVSGQKALPMSTGQLLAINAVVAGAKTVPPPAAPPLKH